MVFFGKLTFSQVTAVFESFKEYYKPCEEDIKARRRYYANAKPDLETELIDEMPTSPQIHYISLLVAIKFYFQFTLL